MLCTRAIAYRTATRRRLLFGSRRAPSCVRALHTSIALQQTDLPPSGSRHKYPGANESFSAGVPETADVVVIGGGVLGCSLAYHLTRQGTHNVILLEKNKLTAGTTWHTAGLVWSLRPSDTEIALLEKSRALMKSLEEETGVHTGWNNNGGLFVAQTETRLNEYKRLHTLGKAFGIESFILSPEETKKLYPLLNVADLCGSLYSPADGTIDPTGYCSSLARGATRRGATIVEHCAVTGIQTFVDDFGTRRVKAVETTQGTIRTDALINACGVWSREIGAMAGVTVPLVCMRHAYVVTEMIEGVRNMPNLRDHDASVYCKLQGDALAVGGYEPNPVFIEQVADDFAFSLYDLDWDVFSYNIDGAINRLPVIETTGIKSTVCGPESFTVDHKPLLGESPEVRGFYLACGFNSGGMMHSIFAEELAKWIIHGQPDFDMYSYDIRRFSTKYTKNKQWCREGSHEAYAKSYSIIYPHDETLASRNLRHDALYEVLLKSGCVYQQRQGWERPGWFTNGGPAPTLPYDYYGYYGYKKHADYRYYDKLQSDYSFDFPKHHKQIGDECRCCRNNVAVINMSYFGKYYLVGPDAQTAADWLFTNDMHKDIGSTIYTCILNKRGGTELDLTVSIVESGSGKAHSPQFPGRGFYLAIGGGVAQHGFSYITDVIQDQKWQCSLLNHSEDMCLISVQGPKSRTLLQSLTNTDMGDDAFPVGTNKLVTISGCEARALRLSFVGELGWELHLPNTVAMETYQSIMEAGKSLGIQNVGYRAVDSLSLEKGYRLWHTDLRCDDNPLQSGLGFTLKLHTDTPFLGRQAVEKSKSEGLKKRLVFFTLDDDIPLFGHEAIHRDGICVGYLRRGDYAYTLDKPMGCGYVTKNQPITAQYLTEGTYQIESMGELYPAKMHLKSPFDPNNRRIRGLY